ncbi:hypothetical protein Tsubulata_048133 [Turnera subulata]|uniref:Cystatin domain-containing protein n=1 Tax=Turnera subulata TaxID=218843 RepID=A0A9Q0JNE2_9ROSI|nr:hypothetical protein Tsubulata_048133 [Turnera subulata]
MATVTLQESVLESQSLPKKQKVDDVADHAAVASAADDFDKCTSDCDSECELDFETPEQRRAIHRYLRELKETQKLDLTLKRIPYAAAQVCAGFIYYIVFEAEDPAFPGETKVYQTKVYDGIEDIELMEFEPRTK